VKDGWFHKFIPGEKVWSDRGNLGCACPLPCPVILIERRA